MISKLVKYIMTDILRSRMVIGYTALMLVMSFSVFSLEDNAAKGVLSMLNVTLVVVPLVSIIFSSIYAYNSADFIEVLVSQPIARSSIWRSLFTGLSASMVLAYLIGTGLALLIFAPGPSAWIMLASGVLLTVSFVGIGLLTAVCIRDKARGIGVVIILWLYFALLFDGLVLFMAFQLADYPLEKAMVVVSALNPIDLSRILVLLDMDMSALMGYTGAVFTDYFGTALGQIISFAVLILWALIPFLLAQRFFLRKDL